MGVPPADAYPLSEAQQERLQKFLPKTYSKLKRKEAVHVALIGDGISRMHGPGTTESILNSMHGVFLRGLEGEFFYTGGVRVINPLGQNPQKLSEHIGQEITVEQFTEVGAVGLNALQQLTTQVFLNAPDLVVLHLGANDAYTGSLVDTYQNAVRRALVICEKQGTEVLLVGPTLVNDDINTVGWGLTRRYAAAARKLAEEFGVMYLDPGLELAKASAIPLKGEAKARSLSVSQSLELELFDHGSASDDQKRYLNAASHERAGHAMFHQFLDGIQKSGYDLFATALHDQPNDLRVTLHFTNRTGEPRQGVITVLNIGQSWEPENGYLPFKLSTGERKSYEVIFRRRVKDTVYGKPIFYREEGNDMELVCSTIVSDLDGSEMVETDAVLGPLSVQWNFTPHFGTDVGFPVEFTLTNPNPDPVSGTYKFTYGNQRATKEFSLGALEAKVFSANCRLPDDAKLLRHKGKVQLQVDTGKHRMVFDREIEVTRDLGLNRAWTLARADDYQVGEKPQESDERQRVDMTASVSNDYLEFTFDALNVGLEQAERKASVLLELALDARPPDEMQNFGFVQPLKISFHRGKERGVVGPIATAAFGAGYSKQLDSRGVSATISSGKGEKSHKIRVRVPKIYLYRHGWAGGGSDSVGLSAKLKFLRIDTGTGAFSFPKEATWVTNDPNLHPYDAAGLLTLELNDRPSGWSVRIY